MAKHNRFQVLAAIKQVGIIPVFYNASYEIARSIISACADSNKKINITYRVKKNENKKN